ncbi:conserved protein of unknown function [Candidatus Filomicrobium marinum]|uniref:DUF4357 domain-containing protein n=1 Tax=Candidatus Filomicrobium marinum TaxID=1608628 RepID=A0A0D6JE30_9HYPH|nr:GIY-YIG nuclease family protein [Candidatus Filomicrobium marinum]CFX18414.1 conserved protein of unknown function [Candidatus Filomicrobium marinum]CPR18371.1 conserved protein of unknown function [Candidatus Filomicrobium marinum]
MTATVEGRSLELYFIEGKPDGMLTAEVFNWTGHILMTPRTRIGAALSRKEARHTGVYILIGEQDGEPRAYIGEGEDISDRIRNHDTRKDWWTTAVLITSTANNLHKAHVKYLEARLIEVARDVGRVALGNGTNPAKPGLSEAAKSNMEAFLDYLFMVLPALRVDMFMRNTRPAEASSSTRSGTTPEFKLASKRHGLNATAVLRDGEFIVLAGSLARIRWEGVSSTYTSLYEELRRSGVLREQGDHCVFTENYAFSSPSAAAAVVSGRSTNGTTAWYLADGSMSYKEWEAAQLQLSSGEAA